MKTDIFNLKCYLELGIWVWFDDHLEMIFANIWGCS